MDAAEVFSYPIYQQSEAKLEKAEEVCGYAFSSRAVLWEALLLANVLPLRDRTGNWLGDGNKGLAGIGDAILKLVIRLQCHKARQSSCKSDLDAEGDHHPFGQSHGKY